MEQVYAITRRAAPSNATVLLTGETGTGKELIARALHELSPRATGPFVSNGLFVLSERHLIIEWHVKGKRHVISELHVVLERQMMNE